MKTKNYILSIFIISGLASSQPLFYEQVSGVTTPLNHVVSTGWSGSNVVSAWICGDNGVVLKTTSNGGTWSIVPVPSNINLNTIAHNTSNSIIALTAGVKNDTAIVYRTTDAGVSWAVVFRQYQGSINAITFNNTSGLMIGNPVGGRWSIWRTTNQGLTFDSAGMYLLRNGAETGFRNSFGITQVSSLPCYVFGTNNYRLYYSTSQGSNWSVITVPFMQKIYSMNFPNYYSPNFIYGYIGGDTNILFTSNSGQTWIAPSTVPPGTGAITGLVACPLPVSMIGNHDVMITRNDNKIYRLGVGSINWVTVYTAPTGNYRYLSYYYAVRDNGGVSWGSCGTYGIQRISDIIPKDFSLSQNYPNPFNPLTKIVFDVPQKSHVRLSVFDVLGKEVARLVDVNVTPGQFETEWDASNMPSGVYFYSLLADNYTQTKKMILIK